MLGVVKMWICAPPDLRLCSLSFSLFCLSLPTGTATKTYLLLRIPLERRGLRWVVLSHIKLLGLQLRNLNSGDTTQSKYYFKVNKLLGWLVKCFVLSKIITPTWDFLLSTASQDKNQVTWLPQNDSDHAFLFLPSVLRQLSRTWLGLLGAQVNAATCPSLLNTDYFSKHDGNQGGGPRSEKRCGR